MCVPCWPSTVVVAVSASVSMHLPPSFGGCVCLFGPFPLCFVPCEFRSQFPSPRNLCLSKRLGLWSLKAEGLWRGPSTEARRSRSYVSMSRTRAASTWFEQRSCNASYGREKKQADQGVGPPQKDVKAVLSRAGFVRSISHRAFLGLAVVAQVGLTHINASL